MVNEKILEYNQNDNNILSASTVLFKNTFKCTFKTIKHTSFPQVQYYNSGVQHLFVIDSYDAKETK